MFPCITPVSARFWPPLEKGPLMAVLHVTCVAWKVGCHAKNRYFSGQFEIHSHTQQPTCKLLYVWWYSYYCTLQYTTATPIAPPLQEAIVKIMKMRKRMTNAALQTELVEILKNMFIPPKKMIKEQVEWLIEHKYMKRDEDSLNTFIYLAWPVCPVLFYSYVLYWSCRMPKYGYIDSFNFEKELQKRIILKSWCATKSRVLMCD